ncbi:hypothetical protein NMY22_g2689 [Coprinellus aureogranulatus]|nr:hypothetical protein NMY22_g2689 [Coprinellus aureogranulatus]
MVPIDRLSLAPQGAFGPLRPPSKAKIPLWMAINLKLKKKCHIVPPEWLTVGVFQTSLPYASFSLTVRNGKKEHLQDRLAQEVAKPDAFSELPFRFTEISKVLLDVASDDLENPDQVRSLLKDLREARQAKSREGLKHLDHSELGLTGLASMEINEIRPFFVQSMSILTKLARTSET